MMAERSFGQAAQTLAARWMSKIHPIDTDNRAIRTDGVWHCSFGYYDLYRGCDKTFETCRDTFSNSVNFRGFPYIPGISDLISGQTKTG